MNEWLSFQVRVPGKWVLAGEHTVLRGGGAVALPHSEFSLSAEYKPGSVNSLVISPSSAASVVQELLQAAPPFEMPQGNLHLESSIPIGAGLGSSAALCVAITRWLSGPLQIPENDFFEFARNLEHRFHGQSSGMDIAVALANEPIFFTMREGASRLGIRRLPKFTFHDTGIRAKTSDCVQKVNAFRATSPFLAMKIDDLMVQAAEACRNSLVQFQAGTQDSEALKTLSQGISQAQEAFAQWQLVPSEAQNLIEQLRNEGALAAKLTGSGGGGYVVALWR